MSNDMDIFCTRCGDKLNPTKAVWLELDQRNGKYSPEGSVPAEHSQGGFPFGRDCAIRERHWWDLQRLRASSPSAKDSPMKPLTKCTEKS